MRRAADGAALLGIGTDPATGLQFCRPVGGGIEAGETPEEAARREILEEIGFPLADLRPLGVVDNSFEYGGRRGREIAHLFEARWEDPALEARPEFAVAKKSRPRIARWFRPEHLREGRVRAVPAGLGERLDGGRPAGPPLRVIAVDGSGAASGAGKGIALAVAREGRLLRLESGRDREGIAAYLLECARAGEAVLAGLGSAAALPEVLRDGGFAIWPFDPPRLPAVVPIDPRVLAGPALAGGSAARFAFLAARCPGLDPGLRDRAADDENAFDAALSALAMDARRGELLSLPAARDGVERREGRIWLPWDATEAGTAAQPR